MDLVYEGIDLDTFDERAARESGPALPEGPLYVCQVGSLIPRKRPRLAAEAATLARRRCPDLRLVLVGVGPLQEELVQMLREPSMGEAVIMVGHVREIPALLRRCFIGLLVSEHEGLPNAVMEYMAAGLPVVVSPLPGVDELVRHEQTGFVVADPTPERLAEALLQLALSPEKRAAFGRAARRHIEEGRFRVETEARAVESVVTRAVGEAAPPNA
jgi:glycosyltransferase involved in cell wall biosynthesis